MGRVSRLEMLDEVEELDLVLGHYAVSWGMLGTKWSDWGLKL
jgi:[phosphatase 2A protein]-leucine-carboxy methyltransferase